MTANKLHKILGELIERGHGRSPVCIDKPSFQHNLEADGCVILDILGVEAKCILNMDDDGGIKMNKDGTESSRRTVVLNGGN